MVTLEYPSDLRTAVTKADGAWRALCGMPLETKERLLVGSGILYEHKDGVGVRADRKENLDVTLAGCAAWLDANQGGSTLARTFMEHAADTVRLVAPVVIDFAQRVESEYGLEGLAQEVEDGVRAHFFVRFIHYPGGRSPEEEIAKAHEDNGGFTLHLCESIPGLQALTHDDSHAWIETPVGGGETIIFPGMQLQLHSKGQITALCHRVLASAETSTLGRYSAVCFVHLPRTPVYDKKRWGRLQEMEEGFNYGMSHEAFQDFFTK